VSSAPAIGLATDDDVAHFAGRRCSDEHERALYYHLAETSPRGVFVAKDEGTPIAIAIAHELQDEWFLSEFFVEPSFRRAGLGHALLAEVAREAGDVSRSGMLQTTESGGLAFFARHGVPIQTPVLAVSGPIPKEDELLRLAAGENRFRTEMIDPIGHRSALSALDRETRGAARPDDHRYFAENAHGVAFYLQNEYVGYAYVWENGRIGPIAVQSATYATQVYGFALAALAGVYRASWCTALLPGTNLRVLRAAISAGLAIDSVRLFASDNAMIDLSRYVGFHRLLF